MNVIDTLQNNLGLGTAVETPSASESSASSEGINQVFGGLMSLMQQNDSDNSAEENANMDSAIDSIQKSLFSAIGLDQFTEDSLSQLTSLDSIANLQTSLLSSLSANLFSSATAAISAEPEVSTTDLSALNSDTTLLGSIQDISNYVIGEDGLGMDDFFDTINILNHIPIVSDIYQNTSHTSVDPVSELLGGFVYGGPIGMAFAAADMAIESFSGKSIYNNVTDYMFEDADKETIESTVSQVTNTIEQANKAYSFVSRNY
ncbi:hypothetical protein [Aliiglaciecola lipolytica]|uniref:hypothetical protein n=1 Tax=Aliiglaciecola lipolytica TaxID=477689 RepID=UPI001C084013|nr:hypothetical protein [Aliiglaciecola lipolytica]MBU2878401.1 hypothetical protein [Aliiglaciecola lipolytica]